jgi:hypothetical protein
MVLVPSDLLLPVTTDFDNGYNELLKKALNKQSIDFATFIRVQASVPAIALK